MKILMIQRAEQFSPNSVEKDLAILEAVAERLRADTEGRFFCDVISETEITKEPSLCVRNPQFVFSMSRLPETLHWLKALQGIPIINSPEGVENCARATLETIMSKIGIPMPPKEGSDGYWLKRGDAAAQSKDDVVFAADSESLKQAITTMQQRGITSYSVSAHVKGDLVKFYGVRDTGFFRYFYPTDDGKTKFEDERRNGSAHHYSFDASLLQSEAERLAEAVGVKVYGGDAIVRSDGSFCFIDFNDWPSFSRCREEAADAIASLIELNN